LKYWEAIWPRVRSHGIHDEYKNPRFLDNPTGLELVLRKGVQVDN
jgi:hypothetical protein